MCNKKRIIKIIVKAIPLVLLLFFFVFYFIILRTVIAEMDPSLFFAYIKTIMLIIPILILGWTTYLIITDSADEDLSLIQYLKYRREESQREYQQKLSTAREFYNLGNNDETGDFENRWIEKENTCPECGASLFLIFKEEVYGNPEEVSKTLLKVIKCCSECGKEFKTIK